VTAPLALVVHERLFPGSQLAVKLQDLGYRTHHVKDLTALVSEAENQGPLVVVIDLVWKLRDPLISISQLATNPKTEHLPIIAYGNMSTDTILEQALNEGAHLVTGDEGILQQLAQLLDQALDMEE
jgi:CheY-like chemotaxis protein